MKAPISSLSLKRFETLAEQPEEKLEEY